MSKSISFANKSFHIWGDNRSERRTVFLVDVRRLCTIEGFRYRQLVASTKMEYYNNRNESVNHNDNMNDGNSSRGKWTWIKFTVKRCRVNDVLIAR